MVVSRYGLTVVLLVVTLSPSRATRRAPHLNPRPRPTEPGAPGSIRLGPVYLTPSLRIHSIGVDTNVFYTATDRRTDFIAHGGPGLEMVVPLHGALKLRADGELAYLYFARTPSQRRLTGTGFGRLGYEGLRLTTGAQYRYSETFDRLGFEVNRRVAQTRAAGPGRPPLRHRRAVRLGGRATAARYDVDDGQEFFGADLRTNLTRDTVRRGARSCPTR